MLAPICKATFVFLLVGHALSAKAGLLPSLKSECELLGGKLQLSEVRSIAVLKFDYGRRQNVLVLLRQLDGGQEQFFGFDPIRHPELFVRMRALAASGMHEGRFCVNEKGAELLSTLPNRQ